MRRNKILILLCALACATSLAACGSVDISSGSDSFSDNSSQNVVSDSLGGSESTGGSDNESQGGTSGSGGGSESAGGSDNSDSGSQDESSGAGSSEEIDPEKGGDWTGVYLPE